MLILKYLQAHWNWLSNLSSKNKNTEFEQMPFLFGSRIALGYGAQFLILGILLPYFPVWLESVGLTAKEIGIVLFIPLVIRVLTSGLVSSFADRQNDRSTVITVLFFGTALSAVWFVYMNDFWPILVTTLVFYFFFNPILPIIDAVTLAGVRRFDADYGRIRIWGSVVFIITNIVGGILLAAYEPRMLLYVLIGSTFFAALVSFAMPRIGRNKNRQLTENAISNTKSFWKNKYFVLVLMAAGLVQASHAMLYGFGSIYWRDIGFSGAFIGVLWAIGVVAEIVLFQFSTKLLKTYSPITFILLGAIGAIIRWSLFPFIESQTASLVLQLLHAISFGAVHIGTMHFIMRSVPEEHIGSGQGVGFVLSGLAMGIFLLASGSLYEVFYAHSFIVMAFVAAAALVILAVASKFQPQSNGDGGVTSELG